MSDHYFPKETITARKPHRCVACGWKIPKGEEYFQQEGFFDGSPYRSRYHKECWDALLEDGYCFEFTTGDVPPPDRLIGKELAGNES